ncbi:MAG: PadR family transcriptional regulator [Acidimicrobiia bacterium]
MSRASTTTYGLLGLLAVRSWTGYELTQQLRRSLRFVWSSSEGHLYREQKRLVKLGWATVEREPAGNRKRNRYTITPEGRVALRDWLATTPQEPHFEIEGALRVFYGDQGSIEDLVASINATAEAARSMLEEMLGFVDEYLEDGGPVWMLEHGVGGRDEERMEFHGRPMFPERLHVVALVVDIVTRLLSDLEQSFESAASEVSRWPSATDDSLTAQTRRRLEAIRARNARQS